MAKRGRNEPCVCGSGKKFKYCCGTKAQPGKKKFKAAVVGGAAPKKVDLMERTFSTKMVKGKDFEGPKTPAHDASENDKPVTM